MARREFHRAAESRTHRADGKRERAAEDRDGGVCGQKDAAGNILRLYIDKQTRQQGDVKLHNMIEAMSGQMAGTIAITPVQVKG